MRTEANSESRLSGGSIFNFLQGTIVSQRGSFALSGRVWISSPVGKEKEQ